MPMLDLGLIREYIDESPGVLEARIRGYGVAVWALVGYLEGANVDIDDVAAGFEIPRDAVRAAHAYYECHRSAIDGRGEQNII